MSETWEEYVAQPEGTANPHLGSRFDDNGTFLPEAGNTVVAQVIAGSETEAALVWLRDELRRLPHARNFAFTEVASYHMTVFEGVTDKRRERAFWPADLPLDTDMPAMTARMAEMARHFAPPPAFRVRATAATPFGLRLAGATPEDEAHMRAWRDGLSRIFGYRSPRHDAYGFHTTLAYVRAWLPPSALPAYTEAMARLTDAFQARVPVLHLARPAFCHFADMNAFPPVLAL